MQCGCLLIGYKYNLKINDKGQSNDSIALAIFYMHLIHFILCGKIIHSLLQYCITNYYSLFSVLYLPSLLTKNQILISKSKSKRAEKGAARINM